MSVIDTAVVLSAAQVAALRPAGVVGVVRYVAPEQWKRITADEYARLTGAGLVVALVYEDGARTLMSRLYDWYGAARQAVSQARAVGHPAGRPFYYAADWDVTAAQWPAVRDALRSGPNAVHGAALTGLYGPYDALEWARRDGVASYFWQSMSTAHSGGRNAHQWPGAHVWQRRQTTLAGADVDMNDVIRPDWAGPITAVGGMMATTDQYVKALCDGVEHTPDGAPVSPVSWQIANEKRFAELGAQLATLTEWSQTVGTVGASVDTAGLAVTLGDVAKKLQAIAASLTPQPPAQASPAA